MLQTIGAFGQDLVGVPGSVQHHFGYRGYVFVGDRVLEKVAHAVYEDAFWGAPAERFEEFGGDEAGVEAVFVGVVGDAPESLGEGFGVAVFAAGGYFDAAPERVPGGVGPLDFGHSYLIIDRSLWSRLGFGGLGWSGLVMGTVVGRLLYVRGSVERGLV